MGLEPLKVKSSNGAGGIDGQSTKDFAESLTSNIDQILTELQEKSYQPQPVRRVEIPKASGGVRLLGIPAVSDRVAQMVVKIHFEPTVEPFFHEDSYGYRPRKSAIQAIEITRKRCWRYDWLLEFDIKGLFDNIGHDLLMRAVRHHTEGSWVILYIERWLKAPFQKEDGTLVERLQGTPQGGLCKALHKPPYAKLTIMQSKSLKQADFRRFQ